MLSNTYRASAPGSLMLLGEYAVLHHKLALVCAVDKRITVTLTPIDAKTITILGNKGTYHTTISQLAIEQPYTFVLAALKMHQRNMQQGCKIEIAADYSDQLGLGSSAAVTVATLAVLASWLGGPGELQRGLLRQGVRTIRAVQGIGSGADVAASVYGGIVAYRSAPLTAEKFELTHPLTLWYAGYKTPTPQVIATVQSTFAPYPRLYHELISAIGECGRMGVKIVRAGDWQQLGQLMSIQQGLMQSLQVCDETLQTLIHTMKQVPGIKGAKISGSGLGDCIVGLGESKQTLPPVGEAIPVTMTLEGMKYETR